MIGVDIVDIARFREMKDGKAFAERVYTEAERAYLSVKKNAAESSAGLFAAKEAVAKALGTGFTGGVTMRDIEILHDTAGKPFVRLSGAAERALSLNFDGTAMYVSISHSREQSIAIAEIR